VYWPVDMTIAPAWATVAAACGQLMVVAFGLAAAATEGIASVIARTAGTSFDIDRGLQRLLRCSTRLILQLLAFP
jgi:hypothetical protein